MWIQTLMISGLISSVICAAAVAGGDPPCVVAPSPTWKQTLQFPNDAFIVDGAGQGEPGWVKFTMLLCDPGTPYYQNSTLFDFHYEFATQYLDPLIGLSLEEFNAVTLFNDGRQALLGAVVIPPTAAVFPPPPQINEYGIQLISQDPLDPQVVVDHFNAIRNSITAAPEVQAFYFPTFEQLDAAATHAAFLEANGVAISSPARWADGDSCYSQGWAVGRLKTVPAGSIEEAFLAGDLLPSDIVLTEGVPAEIPLLAGVLTTAPSTPNSHIAILADTFDVPFAFLGAPQSAATAAALDGRLVALRVFLTPFGTCDVRFTDIEGQLTPEQIEEILALKQPPPLDIQAIVPFPAQTVSTDGLVPDDIKHVGGKAANFGFLRRSIPGNSPVSLAMSFDFFTEFIDQPLDGGLTLRETITQLLAPYGYPPTNMAALDADLNTIRDLFKDDQSTVFTAAQQATILAVLQDPQYGFDPFKKIRFRSSTNVEDSAQFTGAGLYDSNSGCLADDLDGDVVGPSLCDLSQPSERGVFRAIRRVFDSFYNRNAYLERLRHGVPEGDVGMAVLVHHSFPDALELANGVAVFDSESPQQTIRLVTQLGAVGVSNPDLGAIPEEVHVTIQGATFTPTLVTSSNLVVLGDTVMEWPQDYIALAQLINAAIDQFALETGRSNYILDLEYKKMAPGGGVLPPGGLVVKQIREIPRTDDTPSITPFLINEPRDYQALQGGGGTVFANHRLKPQWHLETKNMWLDEAALSEQSIFADVTLVYNDGCRPAMINGAFDALPELSHTYDSQARLTTDSWVLDEAALPRMVSLEVSGLGGLVAPSQSPFVTLTDLGGPDGRLDVAVQYDEPLLTLGGFFNTELVMSDSESVVLVPALQLSPEDQLTTHNFSGPGGGEIETQLYLRPPVGGICAGCVLPLTGWRQTDISGLTGSPITLQGDYSQSYNGVHIPPGWFIFDPFLEPAVPPHVLEALNRQNIRMIYVDNGSVAYLDSVQAGNVCAIDYCPWDVNQDETVNAADLAILLGAWGAAPAHPADFDGNGILNAADLAVLLGNWGACP